VSGFADKVRFGRTGLRVSRLGVGSSYGVSARACRKAFDAGVNYFFWGSIRTPEMASAIQDIARAHRDELVVVLECYARSPWLVERSIDNGLRQLGVGYADVLLLGWHDRGPSERTLEAARRMQDRGRYRFLGISSHQRPLFRSFSDHGVYDVFHVRYNAAHPGAERDVFPYLPEDGPGIASFTNTRWGDLLQARHMPPGFDPPSAVDCYRFVLSDPHVHVAICGPKNDREMNESLSLLEQGPMTPDESKRMRTIGNHVHGIHSFMATFT